MGLIHVEDLCRSYSSGQEEVSAVDGLSLVVERGDFWGLIGPSGSGKSTLLTMLGGLNKPTRGTIVIDGINLYTLSQDSLADFRREFIGFVFQFFHLVPYISVIDNILLPLTVAGIPHDEQMVSAQTVVERVGLAGKEGRLPGELSGGEQQRVAIGRALVNNPPILLADEPTGNLDTATSRSIMDLFRSLNDEGISILMVTHNHENLSHVDQVLHLRDGRAVSRMGNRAPAV